MNHVTYKKLMANLEIQHIQRFQDKFVDPAKQALHNPLYYADNDMIETRLVYKGAVVVQVYSQIQPFKRFNYQTREYDTVKNNLRIDVCTNRKFVKKHKLPYKKTKVIGDKDFVFDNEIQLKLGVSFVRKLLFIILKEVEDKFDYKVEKITSSRCNGIFLNSSNHSLNKNRKCSINIRS